MATIVWKDVHALFNGYALHTALHELNIEYGAEMLDATVFGLNTRTNKGGLSTASIAGAGYMDNIIGSEKFFFSEMGEDACVCVVFPEGVTEGAAPSSGSGFGFAMKGVVEQMDLGGAVGTLANIAFSVQTQGIEAGNQ